MYMGSQIHKSFTEKDISCLTQEISFFHSFIFVFLHGRCMDGFTGIKTAPQFISI